MLSRIISLAFVVFVLGGMAFQRSYMQDSAEEIQLITTRMKLETKLITVKNLSINRYVHSKRQDKVVAQSGIVMTDGKILLEDDIWITRYDLETGKIASRLNSDKALAQMTVPQEKLGPTSKVSNASKVSNVAADSPVQARAENQTNLQSFHFPDNVLLYLEDGVVTTSDVFFSFVSQTIETASKVTYKGQGKDLRGTGMSYTLSDGSFEMGGPVVGTFAPDRLPNNSSRTSEKQGLK